MTILVTGGAGFVGSHLVDALVEAGHRMVVVDDLTTGKADQVHSQATFYKLSVLDPALQEVFAAKRPEAVYHLAAQTDVVTSLDDPVSDARINILGALEVLEACRRYGVRKFIYSSSTAIFEDTDKMPLAEDHPVAPMTHYGVSKHTVEHYLDIYARLYGISYVCLRYGNVYGPRQDPHLEGGVVAIFIHSLLSGQVAVIYGDGEQTRDFIYVADVVEANRLALASGENITCHLAWGRETSINELYRLIADRVGNEKRSPRYAPARQGEMRRLVLDASAARRALDWAPRVSLEEGLDRAVAYHRSLRSASV
ncbi:NAD-dependent epimerase/dehydratase family protein [Nitrospinae bacterium AH_259_B05_G02_I21]|nr:NAD-dependent epimerase/dehydratase family protein [Nitrospinae bacterium AH_259_B05_G02_I21]MDA2931654.1 NAD-dependent epimerase/dehydratase family protein [Nitrospinae bacterium AH-259-F20]